MIVLEKISNCQKMGETHRNFVWAKAEPKCSLTWMWATFHCLDAFLNAHYFSYRQKKKVGKSSTTHKKLLREKNMATKKFRQKPISWLTQSLCDRNILQTKSSNKFIILQDFWAKKLLCASAWGQLTPSNHKSKFKNFAWHTNYLGTHSFN